MDLRWLGSARVEHRHGDSWFPMDESSVEQKHRPKDREREWATGRVFHCAQCDEYIRVSPTEDRGQR